jgi:PTH1 family peptidyl-tRNA hydrolase
LKLIVGLGNPGYEYLWTPHNLGFLAVDRLAEECGVDISHREAQAVTVRTEIENVGVVLAKPQTFMNLSGMAVARLAHKYLKSERELILLVDEIDLPLGALRVRLRGSAGGHNGVKSVIGALGSDEFVRVRMGVGPDQPVEDRVSYLLGPFRKGDLEIVADTVARAGQAVRVILKEGPERAMNVFNRRVRPPQS